MLKEISKSEIDLLRQYLIVPMAVSDILYHDLEVEADMQYGLHMALSEIDPDSALLAIALCAVSLAEKNLTYVPIASALQKEAYNIIDEYGPVWLSHHNKQPMPTAVYTELLETVAEDLEALADLMDALCADLNCTTEGTAVLANLLSVQARAHMEITDFILAESEYESHIFEEDTDFVIADQEVTEIAGDNIIIFPGSKN